MSLPERRRPVPQPVFKVARRCAYAYRLVLRVRSVRVGTRATYFAVQLIPVCTDLSW